eukprot:1879522-Amphidinium_carterae.1
MDHGFMVLLTTGCRCRLYFYFTAFVQFVSQTCSSLEAKFKHMIDHDSFHLKTGMTKMAVFSSNFCKAVGQKNIERLQSEVSAKCARPVFLCPVITMNHRLSEISSFGISFEDEDMMRVRLAARIVSGGSLWTT